MFEKYQHIERFGTDEVQNIELGRVYVFPKIDGTNASVWLNEFLSISAGSRNRELSLDNDNAGFFEYIVNDPRIIEYLKENPTHRLFGEWLVPHSLRTYREDAWRKFYIFDVMVDGEYLNYEVYSTLVEKHDLDYIPPICLINNASYDQLIDQLNKNVFLVEDGKGIGEGIVLKNYEYKNKFGRQKWAKIVTSEFKEKHSKEMGASEINGKKMVEEEIANKYVTGALCDKVRYNIENFSSKDIPRLLNTVYYDVVKEESWNFVKEHKYPTINFNTLKYFVFLKVKEYFNI